MNEIIKLLNILNRDSCITYQYFIKKQVTCFLTMLVFIISSVVFPGFVGIIVDEINNGINYKSILLKCCYMLLFGIIVVISNYFQKAAFYSLGKNIGRGLKEIAYNKVLKSNCTFWNKQNVGEIVTIIEKDIESIEIFLSNIILGILTNLLLICGLFIYISYINIYFGVLLLLLAVIFCCLYHAVGNKAKSNQKELRCLMGQFLAFINETLNNITGIQMTGYENTVFANFKKRNEGVISKFIEQNMLSALTNSIGIFFNVLSVFAILVIGTKQNLDGIISIGDIFNLVLYTQRIYSPILTLTADYLEVKKTMVVLKKVITFLESDDVISDGNYTANNMNGNIVFNDLSFKYDGRELIINQLNYSINKGDVVGVIGNNGCGKTTLMKLMTKGCKAYKGKILIDGIEIDDYKVESLRRNISCMPQSCYFLSGTLRSIIDPDHQYEDRRILEICRDFTIDLLKFPDGLDTIIGENKMNLSGGEAQKISFVRLIVENKPINIMDEPTSEIDIKSEDHICQILPGYLEGKTIIIITHRPRILKICNKILELRKEVF